MKKYIAILLFIFICPSILNAQSFFSFSSGITLAGKQDQKFKQFNHDGHLVTKIVTGDIDSKLAPTFSIAYNSFPKNNNGFRIEWIQWQFTTTVDKDVFIPTQTTVAQDRSAYFISYLHRFPLEKNSLKFYYAGLGAGMVLSDIDPGKEQWKQGMQALAGMQIELAPCLFIQCESKYILTHDVDNVRVFNDNWVVDTSGSPAPFRFGPHFDTRFYTIHFGVTYAL